MTPYLIIMCGPPGTGKTTKAQEIFERALSRGWTAEVVSKDDIRLKYLTEEDDFWAYEDKVMRDYKARLVYSILSHDLTIADASHLTEKQRFDLIQYLRSQCNNSFTCYIAAGVKTPMKLAIERDATREGRHKVGAAMIKQMYKIFEIPQDTYCGNRVYYF